MKKIIILSDASKARIELVSYLKELFPECEIQIITYQSKRVDEDMIIETSSFNLNEAGKTVD
jgi:hypothetical protein